VRGLEVTQGKVEVEWIETPQDTEDFVIYRIHTKQKRIEVVSWNSSSLTLLPEGFAWEAVKPSDFTIIKFPERIWFNSLYQEERYSVIFVQYKDRDGENCVWDAANI
jgi:hypothetical protein